MDLQTDRQVDGWIVRHTEDLRTFWDVWAVLLGVSISLAVWWLHAIVCSEGNTWRQWQTSIQQTRPSLLTEWNRIQKRRMHWRPVDNCRKKAWSQCKLPTKRSILDASCSTQEYTVRPGIAKCNTEKCFLTQRKLPYWRVHPHATQEIEANLWKDAPNSKRTHPYPIQKDACKPNTNRSPQTLRLEPIQLDASKVNTKGGTQTQKETTHPNPQQNAGIQTQYKRVHRNSRNMHTSKPNTKRCTKNSTNMHIPKTDTRWCIPSTSNTKRCTLFPRTLNCSARLMRLHYQWFQEANEIDFEGHGEDEDGHLNLKTPTATMRQTRTRETPRNQGSYEAQWRNDNTDILLLRMW